MSKAPIRRPNLDSDTALLAAIRSEESEICRRAIQKAGTRRMDAAVPILIEFLFDERLRREAAAALGQILD